MNGDTTAPQDVLATFGRPEALEALRAILARSLVAAEPGQVASLSKEFRAALAEQESLAPPERSASDDLAARREARRSTPTAPAPPTGDQFDVGT